MKKEYYNKFAVGLIDSLLIRTDDDYSMFETVEGQTQNQTKRVRIRNGSVIERNKWIGEKCGHLMKPMELSVHEWLCKQNMIPGLSADKIDYEYEYPSPFPDIITKSLLMLRWVTGLQSINKQDAVSITKEDLKEIGLDHMSVMDWKINFDKLFKPVISHYDKGIWTVKIGGRDAVPGNGPGTICIKTTQFTGLLNMIIEHHTKLIEESNKPKTLETSSSIQQYKFEIEDKDGTKSTVSVPSTKDVSADDIDAWLKDLNL